MFRLACSVVLWGGRGTADRYHWCVWGALAVFRPHWVCPRTRHTCIPHLYCSGSRLLYGERALSCVHFPGLSHSGSGFRVLHKDADSVGPVFCAFPGPSCHMTQQSHSWSYSPRKPELKETRAALDSSQHCLL